MSRSAVIFLSSARHTHENSAAEFLFFPHNVIERGGKAKLLLQTSPKVD